MNEQFSARVAEAYGSHSQKYVSILEPILRPMAEKIVIMGRLKGGERVLDLATGTGLIARTAGQYTDFIVGIDISWGVLGIAKSLSAERNPFVTGNAHSLPFGNGCFDLVTCGLSLSHFSEVSVALGEVRRVLCSRGHFITSAWGIEGKNPSKEAAIAVRRKFLEDREVVFEGTFNEVVWTDKEQGCETLRQAGFADIQVTTLPLSGEYQNPEDAIETALAWPLTRYRIARLDNKDQRRLKEETVSAILEVDDLHWQTEIHYYHATRSEDLRKSS